MTPLAKRKSTYDKFPTVAVQGHDDACCRGWASIGETLVKAIADRNARIIVIDCYPGVIDAQVIPSLKTIFPAATFVQSADAMKSPDVVAAMVQDDVTDDAVFGRMTRLSLRDFFDADRLRAMSEKVSNADGLTVVYGAGASLIARGDVTVYLDLARWEIQLRQRKNLISNLGVNNLTAGVWAKYKHAFFVDWRVADDHKRSLWNNIDFFLDTNTSDDPKLINADAVREGLKQCATQPFRVVPFFDPGVWGGQWMKEVCDLPREPINYAWCFDCVPEENSLLLKFGEHRVEIPSINLVHQHPTELLGPAVYGRFGPEFPIRFDFLDTMDGGNLSLQVHPLTEYIQKHFGMNYTQDESYYMLDAADDACVYLGMKTGADPDELISALETAQADANKPLDAEKFVNKWPAKKHDHFLIPAGTIHCSGKNSMVLEISATPYIFTFKVWDWGRLDLNGKPRPINIKHGAKNFQYDRDTQYTQKHLINRVEIIAQGNGWREERTGLHEAEFIETRRHWFNDIVEHHTRAGVNVLNLVEGEEITVESPTNAFAPFVVRYAETFIVPAAVGAYTIRPSGVSIGKTCATMKAYVRTNP